MGSPWWRMIRNLVESERTDRNRSVSTEDDLRRTLWGSAALFNNNMSWTMVIIIHLGSDPCMWIVWRLCGKKHVRSPMEATMSVPRPFDWFDSIGCN